MQALWCLTRSSRLEKWSRPVHPAVSKEQLIHSCLPEPPTRMTRSKTYPADGQISFEPHPRQILVQRLCQRDLRLTEPGGYLPRVTPLQSRMPSRQVIFLRDASSAMTIETYHAEFEIVTPSQGVRASWTKNRLIGNKTGNSTYR